MKQFSDTLFLIIATVALTIAASRVAPAQTQIAASGEVLSPSNNLVVEGIPTVPMSLVQSVKRYRGFYGAYPTGWDKTSREVLISEWIGSSLQVFKVATPNGERQRLTHFPSDVQYVYHHPQAKFFVVNRDTSEGGGSFQLYRYDAATRESLMLTDGKARNVEPVWSRAGNRIVYGSTRRNGKDMDLYSVTLSDPQSSRLIAQIDGRYLQACDWSPDDRRIIAREYISEGETNLWLVDTLSGAKSLLTPQKENQKTYYDCAEFSADGKGIYLITDRESEWRRLAYLDLATSRYGYLTDHLKFDIEEFKISPDGKNIAFVTNEDGVGRLRVLDTQTGTEKRAPTLPVGVVSKIKWHPNNDNLLFNFISARSVLDVYSFNISTGKVERWTTSQQSEVDVNEFADAELVRWKSFDSRMISGFLYRPPAKWTGERPVIVDIHGGPDEQARPEFIGRQNYLLNELGVAVIYPNVRGSSGNGKNFLALDDGLRREDSIQDIGALLDWIKTQPGLDSDRVLVTGASYGGYLALSAAAKYPSRIRAAISDVGPTNLATFLENTDNWRRDLRRIEYGDERDPQTRKFLEQIAPRNNVQKIKTPLLIVQGANDPRVRVSEAAQMVAALKKNGTPVWYLLAKDEGHGFEKQINRDYQFYATVLFIKQFLLPS